MAIALITATNLSATGFSTSPKTLATITPATGNLLVLTLCSSTAQFITAVTDNTGNTWSEVPNARSHQTQYTSLWYAQNIAGGSTTISVTASGTANMDLTALEYSGVSLSAALLPGSGAHANNGGSTGPTSPSVTPSVANQLIVVVALGEGQNLSSVQSPFTTRGFSSYETSSCVGDYIDPSTSAISATFNPTTPQAWASSAAIFQAPVVSNAAAHSLFLMFQ